MFRRSIEPPRTTAPRRRRIQCVFLVASAGISIAACADNDTSLFIRGNLALTPPTCTVRADTSARFVLSAQLDVAFNLEYTAALMVGNQLAPRGAKDQLREESMRITLRGAEVSLTDLDGDEIAPEFSVPGSGFVDASKSENPAYGIISTKVIPATVGADLRDELAADGRGASRTVIASVRVFGDTLGGTEITSNEFSLPIRVCYGCSISFPLEAVEENSDGVVVCRRAGEFSGEPACITGQDSIIDCRQCLASNPVCAAP